MTNLDDIIDGNGLVISGRTEPLVFADYDEMIKWLKQEAHQWDLLYEKAKRFSLRKTAFDNIFNVQKNDFLSAAKQAGSTFVVESHTNSAPSQLEEFLTRVSEGTIPLSDSRIGQLIFNIAHLPAEGSDEDEPDASLHEPKGDLKAAAGLLMMIREEGLSKISSKDFMPEIVAIFRGWERSHEVQNILKTEVEVLSEKVDAVRKKIQASNTAFVEEMQDRRNSLDAYEKGLRAKLATESAVELWRRVAESNSKRGNKAGIGFLALGLAGIILFFWKLSWITEQLSGDTGIANITLVTLPALALAWAMRLASRVFIQSSNAERDAEIRQAQAETYLAFAQDEKIGVKDTERILILNALFRPSGASADDDAPPPNLVELLTRQPKEPT